MRRALLVATLLAAPGLARAQNQQPGPGQILLNNTDADLNASKISTVECSSPTARVSTSFAPSSTAPAAGTSYQLYASNNQANVDPNNANACLTDQNSNPNTNVKIVKVGDPILNPVSLVDVQFATSQIVQALNVNGTTDPCAGSGETTIFLCVDGSSGGTKFGRATGTIILSLIRPDITPQFSLPILPGNTRLTPSWSPTGTAVTQRFQVQAVSVADPVNLPTAGAIASGAFNGFNAADTSPHSSAFVTGSSVTLGGLKNGVVYALIVTGFTDAYSPGDPSAVVSATPQLVNDFFSIYEADGGRETGGCSSGAAGPIGLLVLAGALALVRRRK